jgi:hypothetical protein
MSPDQARLVAYSWKRVGASADRAAMLFYDRLCDTAPATRAQLAAEQMPALRRAFLARVDAAVARLAGGAAPAVAIPAGVPCDLLLGASAEQAGAALFWTLEAVLGPEWTPLVDLAWRGAAPALLAEFEATRAAA